MNKRFGFTLAEVLITLGIIGVVAAMTMPTLIGSTQGAQYKTAYKKALSVLNQAVMLNVALADADFNASTNADIISIIDSRMNVIKKETSAPTDYSSTKVGLTSGSSAPSSNLPTATYFTFSDGISFILPTGAANCVQGTTAGTPTDTTNCLAYIDVNGSKKPNKQTLCTSGTGDTCTVESPSDIYPVYIYDTTVVPATDAAKAVLYGK